MRRRGERRLGGRIRCRLCPTVGGTIDEARCMVSDVGAGATSTTGQYWCNADGLKFLCAPSTDDHACVQF